MGAGERVTRQPGGGAVGRGLEHADAGRPPKRQFISRIGGGHGLASTLEAARRYAEEICAVVTVADDGGSSGRLTRELGVPPPGDIRNCLVALANERELPIDYGILIASSGDNPPIVPDSPAERAGLQGGDIITAINGRRVDASNGLDDVLSAYQPGDSLQLIVLRDGLVVRWIDCMSMRIGRCSSATIRTSRSGKLVRLRRYVSLIVPAPMTPTRHFGSKRTS